MSNLVTMKAERDGGICPHCRCWILAGDVLVMNYETGYRAHRCCNEAQGKPPTIYMPAWEESHADQGPRGHK